MNAPIEHCPVRIWRAGSQIEPRRGAAHNDTLVEPLPDLNAGFLMDFHPATVGW